ncbi:MAG: MFS transporter [Gammaproteobacteria bacterium]|nr:MAG: MFS transporter [Gammaproteobacteria bacterium]
MAGSAEAVEEYGLKLGSIKILKGVSPVNIMTLFFASFFGIAVMSYMNSGQPLIFGELLGVAESEFGRLAGTLTFYHEIVVIIFVAPIGALSDKIGRRPLYMAAFFLIGVGHFLYPLAENEEQLLMYRLVFALGTASASAMLAAVANDYPVESSRAKMIAATMFFNAIGMVVLTGVFKNLPDWYQNAGFDTITSIRYTRWTVSAACMLVAVSVIFGLKKGAPAQVTRREPMLATLRVGIRAARKPRIALSYAAAVVSRGDLAVLSTFFTTWLFLEGRDRGMTATEAMSGGFTFYIVVQAAALVSAPVIGIMLDRIDRVIGLIVAMILAGAGYLSLAFVGDPLGKEMYFAAILIGFGEIAANLSALSLVGKEAPPKGRGAVIGMFSLCGAFGILLVAKIGGILFDEVSHIGPFVLVGIANLIVLVLAIVVLKRYPDTDQVSV